MSIKVFQNQKATVKKEKKSSVQVFLPYFKNGTFYDPNKQTFNFINFYRSVTFDFDSRNIIKKKKVFDIIYEKKFPMYNRIYQGRRFQAPAIK